jgi:hypothetical protein
VNYLFYSCKEMLSAFNLPNIEGKPLSVGARALSKHCIRCKDGWWGDDRGPDPLKNKKAAELLLRIWGNAVWLNIHLLPVISFLKSTLTLLA